MAISELEELIRSNPQSLSNFLGRNQFNPRPLEVFSPPPSTNQPAPPPSSSTSGGGGSNPFAQFLPSGGIPAGTGTGERRAALLQMWNAIPENLRSQFLEQFPNFTPPPGGQGSGGAGGGSFSGGSFPTGLPGSIEGALTQTLLGLLSGEGGFTGELLRNAENALVETSKQREVNRVNSLMEFLGGRGTLESGATAGGITEIGTQESQALFNALNSFQARAAEILQQSIGQGIAGSLGFGELGLRGSELAFSQALQEALFNQSLQGTIPGEEPSSSSAEEELVKSLLGPGSGFFMNRPRFAF